MKCPHCGYMPSNAARDVALDDVAEALRDMAKTDMEHVTWRHLATALINIYERSLRT